MFSFIVSFKGVFLEGMEVVFIVITFGLNANNVPVASLGAVAAVIAVLVIAFAARRPLSMINENRSSTAWACCSHRLAPTGPSKASVPSALVARAWRGRGHDVAILGLLAAWLVLSRVFIAVLRTPESRARHAVSQAVEELVK
jgi:hypothetical protein